MSEDEVKPRALARGVKRLIFMQSRISSFILLGAVVVFAIALRVHTFYLPHNHGDQLHNLGLAMKLQRYGLRGYNLKGIDIVSHGEGLFAVVSARGGQKGRLLELAEENNVFYYSHESLFHKPVGFSFLLMLSHRIFSRHRPFLAVNANLGIFALWARPRVFLDAQFYAVWINFVFSLLFIVLVFSLGSLFFNQYIGLWSALLITISPVDILTSQRLWADEIVSFFTSLTILLFWVGRRKKSVFLMGAGGLSAGLAALAKQSGLFVMFIIVLFEVLSYCATEKRFSLLVLFSKPMMFFFIGAVLVCGFWYLKMALVYKVPWFQPSKEGLDQVAPWFKMLAFRSYVGQFYYFIYLLPLFIFLYYELVFTFIKRIFTPEKIICAIWFFVFIFLLTFLSAKEERFLLPAYPAIAFFSGLALERARRKLNQLAFLRGLGNILIMVMFVTSGSWSIYAGLSCVFNNGEIFPYFNPM